MSIQRVPSPKRWLLDLWLDLERCLDHRTWDDTIAASQFEHLVILLEDKRYLRHLGIDPRSIARVLVLQLANRRKGGASTIEMQFVRTVTQRFERTLSRKFREIVLARLLAFHIGKMEILRSYLAVAYFGHRSRGAEAAANRIFGQSVSDLSVERAAVIAAMLVYPAPRVLPNARWESKVQKRAEYGIRLLAKAQKR